MIYEKTIKHVLTIKIIICIIINILRLKELHSKVTSIKLIDNLLFIKDLARLTYGVLTFNYMSIFYNSIPICLKIRKLFIRKTHTNTI